MRDDVVVRPDQRRGRTGLWVVVGFAAVLVGYPLLLLLMAGGTWSGNTWIVLYALAGVVALVAAFFMIRNRTGGRRIA